ncbi:MAG: dTDP-glucose 4,6-dehydratase [Spirochaetales bacterium]|nr:dTDP-glucose 4,6-dehydratase [Spirochaetales bacterium]MCP5484932.1 dTDP-glucose 4,6-dehydratase [Spirochaetales bacterium]
MNKVLITGGAGFIGSNFTLGYFKNNPEDQIVVLDKLTYAGRRKNLEAIADSKRFRFIQADLADAGAVNRIIAEGDFDSIVHMAAESHVDRSIDEPSVFIQANIVGTANLLDAIRGEGWGGDGQSRRRIFIHVSTDEVFGSLPAEGLFTEESPIRPNSPYAASKASADLLVRAAWKTHELPVISTHCSNNFGPYQFPEKLIPVIIRACLSGAEIPVYGQGLNIRDWIFVDDHCAALKLLLEKGRPGEIYNIGGNNEWRNIDIVNLICELMQELKPSSGSYKDLIRFVSDRPGHDFRYAIDSSKMKRTLGWSASKCFREAMATTIRWYIDNPRFPE